MALRKNILGEKFGRLTVVADLGIGDDGKYHWLCQCDCGGVATPRISSLTSGQTQSCGCYMKDMASEKNTTHGTCGRGNKTAEYTAWTNIKDRCYNPNTKQFHIYGGRGIQVCERWTDFATFLEDMGERPSTKHSIDRIDTNGHYEPSNCRWATPKEQQRNRRNNKPITYNGKTMLLPEWAEEYGVPYRKLKDYVRHHGFSKGLLLLVARTT